MTNWEETYRWFDMMLKGGIKYVRREENSGRSLSDLTTEYHTKTVLMPHAHVFELSPLVMFYLEKTNNTPRPIRLPFASCFLEGMLFRENVTYHGILVYEAWQDAVRKDGQPPRVAFALDQLKQVVSENPSKDGPKEPVVLFTSVYSYTQSDGQHVWGEVHGNLMDEYADIPRRVEVGNGPDDLIPKGDETGPMETDLQFLRRMLMNWYDFIYTPEVKWVKTFRTEAGASRREKKTGIHPPMTSYRILLTGELRKYLEESRFARNKKTYGHKFWVRGHWRTLKSEKAWGPPLPRRVWILPYVKGEGMLVRKQYILDPVGEKPEEYVAVKEDDLKEMAESQTKPSA